MFSESEEMRVSESGRLIRTKKATLRLVVNEFFNDKIKLTNKMLKYKELVNEN